MDNYRISLLAGSSNRWVVEGETEGREGLVVEGHLEVKVPKNVKGGHSCEVVFVTDLPRQEPLTKAQRERGVDAVEFPEPDDGLTQAQRERGRSAV